MLICMQQLVNGDCSIPPQLSNSHCVCFTAAFELTTAYRDYLTTRMTAACKADADKTGSTLDGILDCQANTVEAACNTYATLNRCKDEVSRLEHCAHIV
jgi:hypothetical protein